jgi:hypothetical protein
MASEDLARLKPVPTTRNIDVHFALRFALYAVKVCVTTHDTTSKNLFVCESHLVMIFLSDAQPHDESHVVERCRLQIQAVAVGGVIFDDQQYAFAEVL